MSQEQLQAFIEKVQGDTRLQEKFKAADDSDAVLAIAKEAGFMISADKMAQSEMTEEELEGAAGGLRRPGCVNSFGTPPVNPSLFHCSTSTPFCD
ncbi:nif11-like leader peptide domain protein [Synechococcus sp. BIOS-E4-1]|uniref:Nif11-like leader peptide family natural product precursor n=1 Tax=Synechococcus sp. BIOS-E4-1 TaxID=1400864 RepID=UPI001648D1F8|nr:Nif11-like leader peptide family natural product precursor [Synechococcus sp. BIOS-E4-1]QNI55177.1 nif11-like leader peptide domain protein [Synechococcus sp. BIOS-E4-1]